MDLSSLKNKVLFISYVIVVLISLWIAAMYFCLKHDGIAKSYFLAASVIGFLLILLLPVAGTYPYLEFALLWIVILIQLILLVNGGIELWNDISIPQWIKTSVVAIPILYFLYVMILALIACFYSAKVQ